MEEKKKKKEEENANQKSDKKRCREAHQQLTLVVCLRCILSSSSDRIRLIISTR
jgi:hypothetical protein